MTTCAVQGQIYAGDGSAVAVVGRPAVLVLRLINPEGGYYGLTGRAFRQLVLTSAGDELVEVEGEAYDAEGVRFTVTDDQVTSLLPADRPSIDLVHTIEEITDDGAVEIFTRKFSVRRKASGAPAAIVSVGVSVGGHCDQVVVSYAGASAPSPFAEWLAKPGNEDKSYADFLASITGSEMLVTIGALAKAANKLLHTGPDGEAMLSAMGPLALDLIAALDAPAARAVIGAAEKHNAALTGAPTASTPDGADDSERIATTGWSRAMVESFITGLVGGAPDALDTLRELSAALGDDADFAGTMIAALATKAAGARTVTGGGLVTGGGDLTADRVLTVTEASDAEALAGVAADKAMTPRRTKAAIDASAALKADNARTVTGGGLVTGGGDLAADRVLTVTEASDAEALAGVAADKAMTPRRTKAAIDAAVAALLDGAPGALNTLNELAAALDDDDDFAATVANALAAKAAAARTVTGGGLVTGGGDLTADRVLTVTEASDAEALAGVAADKAMTPRRTKVAIDAAKDEVLDAISSGLTFDPPFPDGHWLRVEAIDADNTSFNFNRSTTVNLGNADRPNEVVNFGHNLDPGGGPETPGKGLFGMGFEGHYEPNPGEAYFEWHIYAGFEDDGIQRRPDSLRMDKNSNLAFGWGRLMRHNLLTYTEPKKNTPYMQAGPGGATWWGIQDGAGEPVGGFSMGPDTSDGDGTVVYIAKSGVGATGLGLGSWDFIRLPGLVTWTDLHFDFDGQGRLGKLATGLYGFRHTSDIAFGRFGGNDLIRLDNTNGRIGLGTAEPAYTTHISGDLGLTLPDSITPAADGDLVVEATSDTVITFKLKGLDGTVRTFAMPMAPVGAGLSLALGGATLGTNVLAVSGNTNMTAGAGVTLETSSSLATASAYVRVIRAMSTTIGGAATGAALGYKMNAGGTAPEAAFVNSQAGMPLLLGVNGGTNDQLALNADGSAVLKGVLKLTNQSEPATPTGGGVIYVEGGALKYKGVNGSVTTLGAA